MIKLICKKMISKVVTVLESLVYTDTIVRTINWYSTGNPFEQAQIDVRKDGYIPIAAFPEVVGAGSTFIYFNAFRVSPRQGIISSTCRRGNTPSSTTENTMHIVVVYVKDIVGGYCVTSVFSRLSDILCHYRKVVA